jgi:hypothetical protein
VLWYALTMQLAQRCFPVIARWRLSKVLRLKDTLQLGPDVLLWERKALERELNERRRVALEGKQEVLRQDVVLSEAGSAGAGAGGAQEQTNGQAGQACLIQRSRHGCPDTSE